MPWPGYQILQLADQQGFFTEEGANVRLLNFSSLGDTRRAFERHQIDAMCCTLVEVITTYEHSDQKPRAIFVIDYSDGTDVIISRDPIQRVEDLRGRSIGAEPGTIHTYLLARALQQAGLSLDAVRLCPIAGPNMPTALARGEIEAAVSYRPWSRELLRQADATVVYTSKSIPGEIIDVLAAGSRVIEERRDELVAVTRALDRATKFMNAHPEEAAKVMARFGGISPDEFKADTAEIRFVSGEEQAASFAPGGPVEQAIKRTVSVLQTAGYIHKTVQPADAISHLFTPAEGK